MVSFVLTRALSIDRVAVPYAICVRLLSVSAEHLRISWVNFFK
jgi:hypothetical protein